METINAIALHYGPGHADGPGAWWPIFPILWLLFLVGVVTVLIVMSRHRPLRRGRQSGYARLAERFADGEISEDEYRARRAVIGEKSS